jgi:DNA-binding IclR family transcriptional regulator
VLENKERHQKLCIRSREKAEAEFSMDLQARRYLSLFNGGTGKKSDSN